MRVFRLMLIVSFVVSGTAGAHNGFTRFVPMVPNPLGMTIDGVEDDWDWYDPKHTMTEWVPEDFTPQEVREDDLLPFAHLAWSPPPDNGMYFFARVQDDTLSGEGSFPHEEWWQDDYLKLSIEMDHAGISLLDTVAVTTWYAINMSPLHTNQLGLHLNQWRDNFGDGGGTHDDWAVSEEFAEWVVTLTPENAVHLSPFVEYTYELKLRTFDLYDDTNPPASIPHVFKPDQVFHMRVDLIDADHEVQQHWWSQPTDRFGGDYQTLPLDGPIPDEYANSFASGRFEVDGGQSVVEHITWARIKAVVAP